MTLDEYKKELEAISEKYYKSADKLLKLGEDTASTIDYFRAMAVREAIKLANNIKSL